MKTLNNNCNKCGLFPKYKGAACNICYNLRTKERRNLSQSKGNCAHCQRPKDSGTLCIVCKTEQKAGKKRLKLEVFNALGGCRCVCCGETHIEFLSIDHIAGNGNNHRKEINNGKRGGGQVIFVWLKKNNYPEGFQVLCMNCNFAKGKFGACPHENTNAK